MNNYDWIKYVDTYLNINEIINEYFNKMRKSFNHDEIEEKSYYLSIELMRMIPFKGDKQLIINDKSGICLLKNNIDFLINDLDKILQENSDTLAKIKRIRNKYEHEPHNIKAAYSTSSGAYAGIGFYYKNELIPIDTKDMTYIIWDLNILMNKIQKFVYTVEKEHEEEFDIFVKNYIKDIKIRKNIEYNNLYTRIPKWPNDK